MLDYPKNRFHESLLLTHIESMQQTWSIVRILNPSKKFCLGEALRRLHQALFPIGLVDVLMAMAESNLNHSVIISQTGCIIIFKHFAARIWSPMPIFSTTRRKAFCSNKLFCLCSNNSSRRHNCRWVWNNISSKFFEPAMLANLFRILVHSCFAGHV